MDKYYIVYSSSNNYSYIMCSSIVSLFEKNKNYNLELIILSNSISNENKDKIKKICKTYDRTVKFYEIEDYKKYVSHIFINNKWDFASFGRLFISNILPNEIEKILYLDCDTIVMKSIIDLYDYDISNVAVAGVKECLHKNYCKNINVESDRILLNAGVLLMNLNYIRQNNITQRFIDCLSTYENLEYLDQDVLNIVLNNDEKLILPLNYNAYSILYYFDYKEILKLRKPNNFYLEDNVESAKRNPAIVHFTTCRYDYGRPWNCENNHPLKSEFILNLRKSGFEDELSHIQKNIFIKIVRILPKKVSILISLLINQYIKPLLFKAK